MRSVSVAVFVSLGVASTTDFDLVVTTGNFSTAFISITDDQIEPVLSPTKLDFNAFAHLTTSILPRAQSSPDTLIRDIVRNCVQMIKTEIDPSFSVLIATIWCLAASRHKSGDIKLNLVLTDEAFSNLTASITRQLDFENTIERWKKSEENILDLGSAFHEAKRDRISNMLVIPKEFWYKRKFARELLHGSKPAPNSVVGNIYESIESIPPAKRLAILQVFSDLRYRKFLYSRIMGFVQSFEEKLYANYIITSIYIPESMVDFLQGFARRSVDTKYKNIGSASDIVEYFVKQNPEYKYLTPDLVLEWYKILTIGDPISFDKLSDFTFPGNSSHIPKLNFAPDLWKQVIIAPRADRLYTTGVETFWNL